MTTNDIIDLAREAGFKDPTPADGYMGNAYDYRDGKDSGGSLTRFAALVRNATLEEAAKCSRECHPELGTDPVVRKALDSAVAD